MSVAGIEPTARDGFHADAAKHRHVVIGDEPAILGEIYQQEANIVIWQRELSATLSESVTRFAAANPSFQMSFTVAPDYALSSIRESLSGADQIELAEDIARLVEMFCFLFDLNRAGLRLATLDRAMCPRFHVDRVPCRLVTTYHGTATEWLPHHAVNRTKLGSGSNGLSDTESGLIQQADAIQQMDCGDVALLKGELWDGNENAGLVHRSPQVPADGHRLLLSLDFSD